MIVLLYLEAYAILLSTKVSRISLNINKLEFSFQSLLFFLKLSLYRPIFLIHLCVFIVGFFSDWSCLNDPPVYNQQIAWIITGSLPQVLPVRKANYHKIIQNSLCTCEGILQEI